MFKTCIDKEDVGSIFISDAEVDIGVAVVELVLQKTNQAFILSSDENVVRYTPSTGKVIKMFPLEGKLIVSEYAERLPV